MTDDTSTALAVTLAEIKRDIADLAREVATITRYVIEGNGTESLLVRVALVERTMGNAVESIRELTRVWEARASEGEKGRWQLVTTIVSGLIALGSAVVTAMFALRK